MIPPSTKLDRKVIVALNKRHIPNKRKLERAIKTAEKRNDADRK
jgi:hypothetical protein